MTAASPNGSEPARVETSSPPVVLVVDDDDTYRTALARAFERRGFEVLLAGSVAEGAAHAEAREVRYASVDLRMPGASGLDLVRRLTALHPSAVVVVLTGYGSIATAVEAVRLGARDYLTKPADANDLLRAFGALDATSGGAASAPRERGAVSATGATAANDAAMREVPSLARVEWEHISRVVADCGGNISQAARLLRMQRRSLQRKLAKYPVSR
ncbi:MAG TPA: response regulator [Polyangiaceae bacterium]|nr:response regulator [Polyangiaceae bacterium]